MRKEPLHSGPRLISNGKMTAHGDIEKSRVWGFFYPATRGENQKEPHTLIHFPVLYCICTQTFRLFFFDSNRGNSHNPFRDGHRFSHNLYTVYGMDIKIETLYTIVHSEGVVI